MCDDDNPDACNSFALFHYLCQLLQSLSAILGLVTHVYERDARLHLLGEEFWRSAQAEAAMTLRAMHSMAPGT